jgi:hypothetical protein
MIISKLWPVFFLVSRKVNRPFFPVFAIPLRVIRQFFRPVFTIPASVIQVFTPVHSIPYQRLVKNVRPRTTDQTQGGPRQDSLFRFHFCFLFGCLLFGCLLFWFLHPPRWKFSDCDELTRIGKPVQNPCLHSHAVHFKKVDGLV